MIGEFLKMTLINNKYFEASSNVSEVYKEENYSNNEFYDLDKVDIRLKTNLNLGNNHTTKHLLNAIIEYDNRDALRLFLENNLSYNCEINLYYKDRFENQYMYPFIIDEFSDEINSIK